MNVFIDTSSLLKLYHLEEGSQDVLNIVNQNLSSKIFLSKIAKLEFSSALWKKVRTGEINSNDCKKVLKLFYNDSPNYHWIEIAKEILDKAQNLLSKYGESGLRTLDSIQLSTAVLLKPYNCINVSSDKLLLSFMEKEGLKIYV